jgi:hypothetical protein
MTRAGAVICLILIFLAAVAFVGAGGVSKETPQVADPTMSSSFEIREFLDARLDTVFSNGSYNDTLLLNPIRIAARGANIYVFDAGDQSLKSLSGSGRLLWRVGREGSGPQEFRKVRDLSIGIAGKVLVADQTNERLSVYDSAGQLEKEITLRYLDASIEQVIEIAPDTFLVWALGRPDSEPLVILDEAGSIVERADAPFEIASSVPFLGAQAKIGTDARRPGRWVYAFIFVDRWRTLQRLMPISEERRYIEPLPVPEVEIETDGRASFSSRMRNAVQGALSLSVVGDTAFVLFRGRTAERGRLVDLYDIESGSYLGSILLPGAASALAATHDRLVLLSRDPYPQVTSLRYHLTRRP